MERPHFNPGRLEPCFCRSGQRFKNCCGTRQTPRRPPFSVHIVNDFIPESERVALIAWADGQGGEAMEVVDGRESNPNHVALKKTLNRVTDKVELDETRAQEVGQWVCRAIKEHIEPAFQREMAWFEPPNLMRYSAGGWFRQHADSEYFDHDRKLWVKTVDREISLLMYLNDEYTGGVLNFPVFNFRYRPRAGDLLFFPSDGRFQHEAEQVESGKRYAIATWAAAKNAPRVLAGPPEGAVHL